MSLKGFHIIFVLATVSLSVFFSYWSYKQFQLTQSSGYMASVVVSIIVAIGFLVYGFLFAKKIKA